MKEHNKTVHLTVDDIVTDLITDYHDKTHSEVIAYFYELINQSVQCEGNIANEGRYPKLLFKKQGKPIYKMVKVDPEKAKNYTYNPFSGEEAPHNLIWVVRGFYPESKVPFKLSIVHNREFGVDGGYYWCKVVLGDKLRSTKFDEKHFNAYQKEVCEAILLDRNVKDLEQIPYKRKTFRCMRPKGIPLLKKYK